MTQFIITLYGPRKKLIAIASAILSDEAVEKFELVKDQVEDYAFITATDDLLLDTYEAIEDAGLTYETVEEAA